MKQDDTRGRQSGTPKPGDYFNPYKMFTGIFIPEALVKSNSVSPGAKLAYGRLARYSGEDGGCWPTMRALGAELGVSERQAHHYVRELETLRFIEGRRRGRGRPKCYRFLWHEVLDANPRLNSPTRGSTISQVKDRKDPSAQNTDDRKDRSAKRESVFERESGEDLDSLPTSRKKRDTRADDHHPASSCKQYPSLRKALAEYMEGDRPSDRLVVDVRDAAGGATEEEVIECLRYLRDERGLKPGTKNGPRHWSWFKTVVADYFDGKRARAHPAAPSKFHYLGAQNATGDSRQQLDAMTDAIEIDHSEWQRQETGETG